jgi:hypothetical protein
MDKTIQLIRKTRGRMTIIANRLDLRLTTIILWKQVPLIHVFDVAEILKIPVEQIRPDFFVKDPLRKDRIPASMKCAPAKWKFGWKRGQRKRTSAIAAQSSTVPTNNVIAANVTASVAR